MGGVTVLAMLGLGIGHRYHRRLEGRASSRPCSRGRETETPEGTGRELPVLSSHGPGRARMDGQQHRPGRCLLEDCPPSSARLGMALPERAMPSRHALPGPRSVVTPVTDGHLRSVQPDGRSFAPACKDGTVRALGRGDPEESRLLGGTSTPYSDWTSTRGKAACLGRRRRRDPDLGHRDRIPCEDLAKATEAIYARRTARTDGCWPRAMGIPPGSPSTRSRQGGVPALGPAERQPARTHRGHTQNVTGVAFSPDGLTLASVSGSCSRPAGSQQAGRADPVEPRDGQPVGVVEGQEGP